MLSNSLIVLTLVSSVISAEFLDFGQLNYELPETLLLDQPLLFDQDYGLQANSSQRRQCDPDCERDLPRSRDVPHIITPRQSMSVLSDTPIIRWYLVEGAEKYTITVIDHTGVQWKTSVSGDRWWVRYEGKPLIPEKSYSIEVDAHNNHRPSQQNFVKLSQEQAEMIQAQVNQIGQTSGGGETEVLAVVALYRQHNLMADAVDLLESLVEQSSQNPQVYCNLYQIYQQLRLGELATRAAKVATDLGQVCSGL